LVSIAVLLGGNAESQQQFYEYILEDHENEFCVKLRDLLTESFELIKKNQVKRNTKKSKIQNLEN